MSEPRHNHGPYYLGSCAACQVPADSDAGYEREAATPPLDVPDGPSFSVVVDSALTRIEQLLTRHDSTPQGQRRWADVDTALDVAHAARRYIAKHGRLAQQDGTGE